MTVESNGTQPAVDVVIPVYGERQQALTETLSACANQTYPINRILVVDDGSPQAVCLPTWAQAYPLHHNLNFDRLVPLFDALHRSSTYPFQKKTRKPSLLPWFFHILLLDK